MGSIAKRRKGSVAPKENLYKIKACDVEERLWNVHRFAIILLAVDGVAYRIKSKKKPLESLSWSSTEFTEWN